MTVGYLANAFDLLNIRDLDLIAEAGQHCSRLVVGVFTDDFAEVLLGRRPVVPLDERMALVAHVRGVHHVVEHDEATVSVDHGGRVFAVAGDPALRHIGATWLLSPARRTSSVVLAEALAPAHALGGEAVSGQALSGQARSGPAPLTGLLNDELHDVA